VIVLSGIQPNVLTRFIETHKQPADIPLPTWGACLLSLTSLPDKQIAEVFGKTVPSIRSIRRRNRTLVEKITADFIEYFIGEAEAAFVDATDKLLAWSRNPATARPSAWTSAFSVRDLIHPRVTVAIMETMVSRGLVHLLPFAPVDDELNHFMRGIFRKGLYSNLREYITKGGDKALALASLALLDGEDE